MKKVSVFWFRRDLRLEDNAGLYHALQSKNPVLPLFIFDTDILEKLENRLDARVEFIQQTVAKLSKKLEDFGSSLLVKTGKPLEIFEALLQEFSVQAVYTNRDYEPYARKRDEALAALLEQKNIPFRTFKDQVIFEQDEVVKPDGKPYTVYTPYRKKWEATLQPLHLKSYPVQKYAGNFLQVKPYSFPTLKDLGFAPAGIPFPKAEPPLEIIRNYASSAIFRLLKALRGWDCICDLAPSASGNWWLWLKKRMRFFFRN